MIATDGQKTFALFIYGDIEWGDNDTTIGFNAGDGVRSIVVTTPPLDVGTGSNVGVTGLYISRIDLSVILSPDDGERLLVLLEMSSCQQFAFPRPHLAHTRRGLVSQVPPFRLAPEA